ncbi:MAG TPA: hypothetical protein VMT17_03275 [Anaeromyxobacteraceae bacterium]|nr:hypothetical protein [Anaeromyxobacteraceae bacterium]
MAPDELDDIHAFEAKDTATRLPWGWVLLLCGLVVWGVYYGWTYTPPRWSQAEAYEKAAEVAATTGSNIFATVFFTVAAITVAVVLLVAVSRKRAAKGS